VKYMLILAIFLFNHQIDNLLIKKDGETIAAVNRSDFIMPILNFPFVDYEKIAQLEKQLEQQITRVPVNAGLDKRGNIIPEQPGIALNKSAFTEQFYSYIYGNGQAAIEVPVKPIFPRVDSELISEIKVKLIGHYVTFYNSYNKERSHNISLATEAINNCVLFPGETFSFNKIVGKRTKAKGYLPAPVIVKGELSEGIGGGICQVSSTLFNAADRSGLSIIERYSHSKRVPYVPEGRDATVSWYGVDFSFKNKYNQPILIRAEARDGKMIVLIYSSESIHHSPRDVPRMSSNLPKEVPATL
jgi:vancomycin resistance protein YoaR